MPMETENLVNFYKELNRQYPLFTLEDGFYEDDWEGWIRITQQLPETIIQSMGCFRRRFLVIFLRLRR